MERIAAADDPSHERDVLAGKAVRIAGTVVPLVARADEAADLDNVAEQVGGAAVGVAELECPVDLSSVLAREEGEQADERKHEQERVRRLARGNGDGDPDRCECRIHDPDGSKGAQLFVCGFFAASSSSSLSSLQVRVRVKSLLGVLSVLDGGKISAKSTWQPSARLALLLTNLTGILATDSVSFQFVPSDGASWRTDDVYLDPWKNG
jgi:hypothetical protein